MRQRIFQMACGYEGQNGSNSLRFDPLLKLVCGSLPETGGYLASQPTISRLENAATTRAAPDEAAANAGRSDRLDEGGRVGGEPTRHGDRRTAPGPPGDGGANWCWGHHRFQTYSEAFRYAENPRR